MIPETSALPPLLTVQETADFLQLSTKTIYRERRRGKLAFTRAGGSARIRRSELERYLRESERVA